MQSPQTLKKALYTGLLAAAALASTAHAEVSLESVTYEGVYPEDPSLFSFFESGFSGFDSYRENITGIPKFDPTLGTLVDVQISFSFEYNVEAFVYAEGIFDDGLPHFVDAGLFQRVIGITYERADGGTSGLIDFDDAFFVGCFGDAFSGGGCADGFSAPAGFGTTAVSLFDDLAMEDVVGTGDVEIIGFAIDYIDSFFDLNNVGAAFLELSTDVDTELSNISITYIYDTGMGEPDTDEDGVSDSMDSCINTANANQIDSDGDGFGDACDVDINNDCVVNAIDLGLLRVGFFGTDPVLDFNNDGAVNAVDLGLMRLNFFTVPGPSGLTSVCD